MMTAIWNHCLGFMATILLRIDAAAEPVLKNDGLLILIALAALILGPLLTFANLKLRARASEDLLDSLEHSHGYYGILSRLFYYPVAFSTSLLCPFPDRAAIQAYSRAWPVPMSGQRSPISRSGMIRANIS